MPAFPLDLQEVDQPLRNFDGAVAGFCLWRAEEVLVNLEPDSDLPTIEIDRGLSHGDRLADSAPRRRLEEADAVHVTEVGSAELE